MYQVLCQVQQKQNRYNHYLLRICHLLGNLDLNNLTDKYIFINVNKNAKRNVQNAIYNKENLSEIEVDGH